MLLSITGPTDLTLHEVERSGRRDHPASPHPDANIIFGAVVDDAVGDEVRVTVVAAGFDRVGPPEQSRFESRLSRLLEEPARPDTAPEPEGLPSILAEDTAEDDVFVAEEPEPVSVSFDAEEDLDIPDFLKS
ncbi:MAG: hypothetical protein KatS3mg013_0557 [Actinomycetota bacterium]|nr:MAG: hypothetical protein KatS3mg013_0557 [Actinomycetota bacterium]